MCMYQTSHLSIFPLKRDSNSESLTEYLATRQLSEFKPSCNWMNSRVLNFLISVFDAILYLSQVTRHNFCLKPKTYCLQSLSWAQGKRWKTIFKTQPRGTCQTKSQTMLSYIMNVSKNLLKTPSHPIFDIWN